MRKRLWHEPCVLLRMSIHPHLLGQSMLLGSLLGTAACGLSTTNGTEDKGTGTRAADEPGLNGEVEEVPDPHHDDELPQTLPDSSCEPGWTSDVVGTSTAESVGEYLELDGCWEGSTQLPPSINQRTYRDGEDWVILFDEEGVGRAGRGGLAWDEISGEFTLTHNASSAHLHRVSAEGELEWTRSWRGEGSTGFAVVALEDGGVLVGGEYQAENSPCDTADHVGQRSFVTRFGSEGAERWTLSFGLDGAGFNRVMSMELGETGEVFLAGQAAGQRFVLALDLETQKPRFTLLYPDGEDGPRLAMSPDGSLIVLGAGSAGSARALDAEGNVLWSRKQCKSSIGRPEVGDNGDIWFEYTSWTTAALPGWPGSDDQSWIVRFDSEGAELGRRTLLPGEPRRVTLWSAANTGSDYRLLLGRIDEESEDPGALLYFLNSTGERHEVDRFPLASGWTTHAFFWPNGSSSRWATGGSSANTTDFGLDIAPVDPPDPGLVGSVAAFLLSRTVPNPPG